MSEPVGRREAHKQATRAAVREAAERLFAEHGYEATTVRAIARAAQVTERTVYRYFDGKEELLADQTLAWVDELREAIVARPPGEPDFVAVWRALPAVAGRAAPAFHPARAGHKSTRPLRPIELLQRAAPRPLRRLEDAIAEALLARRHTMPGRVASELGPDLEARLVARVAVAALRTAANRAREQRETDETSRPDFEQIVDDAFAALVEIVRA